MTKEVLPINDELEILINEISNVKNITTLYEYKYKIKNYIFLNKNLKKEFNSKIKYFEKTFKTTLFTNNLEEFSKILEVRKNNYAKTLPTDDVKEIFYFPTMGRMSVRRPNYDSVYPKPFNGVYELYYALASINEIEVLPKELFVDTKNYVDFYILYSLKDYKILPQHIGSVRPIEYCNANTLFRLDNCEDEFLICWLRAVLLGVLNKLIEPTKIKYPVVLNYFKESNSFKLNDITFKLGPKEADTLKFLIKNSFIEKAYKSKYKDFVRVINKKAFAIINTEIIINKRCEPYEFDKKIVKIKEQ